MLANNTADHFRLKKGIYVMTDILGNQRKVEVVPAEKSVKIIMVEDAPRLKNKKEYNEFIYNNGTARVDYENLYAFSEEDFKVYADELPLYLDKL